ncbi:MAG TPA: VOC family protein [Gemmatimonadaceae bacterium]|jgi:catechol 2,3-dioxygenase|nr:VOC family protein [Gemmatimonadaceae bacterium]
MEEGRGRAGASKEAEMTTGQMPGKAGEQNGIRPKGYRLPESTHLGRVRLQVADLNRSLLFYENVLGLRVINRTADSASLGPHGEDREIVHLRQLSSAKAVPRRGLLGLYHFAILLPDRASLGRFVAHLSEIGAYAGMSDHFVSEAVYLTDPDGLGIEVYADRPRDAWRYDERQLYMTTNHLDVDDLVKSARDEPWTGIPAGTVLGHVHLYVDDIDKAEAFYHDALGFDKVVWSYPGALFLSAGGYHHHLGTNTWAKGAPAATDADARLLEWEIVVPTKKDADQAAQHVVAASHPAKAENGEWILTDPWGTSLRLVPEKK